MWLNVHLTLNLFSSTLTAPICLYRPFWFSVSESQNFIKGLFSGAILLMSFTTQRSRRTIWGQVALPCEASVLSVPVLSHREPVFWEGAWSTLEGTHTGVSVGAESSARFQFLQHSLGSTVSWVPEPGVCMQLQELSQAALCRNLSPASDTGMILYLNYSRFFLFPLRHFQIPGEELHRTGWHSPPSPHASSSPDAWQPDRRARGVKQKLHCVL